MTFNVAICALSVVFWFVYELCVVPTMAAIHLIEQHKSALLVWGEIFLLLSFPMLAASIGFFIAATIPNKTGRYLFALIVPCLQIVWFVLQVRYGFGLPYTSAGASFHARLAAGLLRDGLPIASTFLVLCFFRWPKITSNETPLVV